MAIAQQLGLRRSIAHTLGNIGNTYVLLKDLAKATTYYQQQLEIAKEICDRPREAIANLAV